MPYRGKWTQSSPGSTERRKIQRWFLVPIGSTILTFHLTDIVLDKVFQHNVEINALLRHFQHKKTFFRNTLSVHSSLSCAVNFCETMNLIRYKEIKSSVLFSHTTEIKLLRAKSASEDYRDWCRIADEAQSFLKVAIGAICLWYCPQRRGAESRKQESFPSFVSRSKTVGMSAKARGIYNLLYLTEISDVFVSSVVRRT